MALPTSKVGFVSEFWQNVVHWRVQLSHSVMSYSLWLHGLQHTRPPCPSKTPNSCPLSQWCHPPISSSVISFYSNLQSFPASGSFQMSQLFSSGGQSIGVSDSISVLPMNTQDWSPLGWTGWISLLSKGLSRVFSNTTVWKHQFFGAQPFNVSGFKTLSRFCLVVQSLSRVWLFATTWNAAFQAFLYLLISWSLLKLLSTS